MTTNNQKRQKRKRRGKSPRKHYFTKEHEEAIIKYAQVRNVKERTKLYMDYIQPVFNEMVDKIVYTYKFTNLPNIDSLKEECKVWLTTILDKFDPSKGSKAFSYFSVITKNWFIHKVKKNTAKMKKEVQYEQISAYAENEHMSVHNPYHDVREKKEFWLLLWQEIGVWSEDASLKENEKRIIEAVKILLDSLDDIEIFNKKAIYLYLREITGLNTKQVVNNLNKVRFKYRIFKEKWDKGEL